MALKPVVRDIFDISLSLPVVLCKLAVEVIAKNKEGNEDLATFMCCGKRWKCLDFLQSQGYVSIGDILKTDEYPLPSTLHIEIIENAGQNWIALCFTNTDKILAWKGRLNLPSALFSILFHEIKGDFMLPTDHREPKVIKKYVTTTLFKALYEKHASLIEGDTYGGNIVAQLPKCFRPKLCRYQQKAVAWILQREQEVTKVPNFYIKLCAKDNETIVYAHKFYTHVVSSEPEAAVLPTGGILAEEMGLGKTVEMLALMVLHIRPPFQNLPEALAKLEDSVIKPKRQCLSTTYCLCGSDFIKKRNEIIQCVKCELLQHKKCVCKFNEEHSKNINDPYICPACWSEIIHKEKQLVPSGATFIISPNAIKSQWFDEIQKHLYPAPRVFVYDSLAKSSWISPRQLADYDVVITDYSVLRKEFYHTVEHETDRVTRKKPRRMRCNTPLLMVEWWRVCLDEAQMVESNVSITAKLAFQLPAVHRWAVTGTPIQSSIDDLHSLLAFVGFYQICYPRLIWDRLVRCFLMTTITNVLGEEPCSEEKSLLIDLLQLCMWRTCKSNIVSELKIPPQNEEVHFITLSNLEKLFYSEQHAACGKAFNDNFTNYINRHKSTSEISPNIMKIFLEPLLKIRQCCTIPVVVNNSSKAYHLMGHKKFLQPKELHAHLKSANESECKTELRSMASAYNGMAALYFIREKYADAIKHYELVLQLARDYVGLNLNVDSLLQIHALHNILQAAYTASNTEKLLSAKVVADYQDQCNALEWKYLETYASKMKSVQEAFQAEEDTYYTLTENNEEKQSAFLAEIAGKIAGDQFQLPLMDKIYDECLRLFPNCETLMAITSIHSATYVMTTWHDKVITVNRDLISRFKQLQFFTNNVRSRSQLAVSIWEDMTRFVNKVYDCHMSEIRCTKKKRDVGKDLSKSIQKKDLCDLCKIRDILNNFECLLFNKVVDEETNMTEGLYNPSPQIALIKALFNFIKSNAKLCSFSPQIEKFVERINCLQRLCKKMWKYWIEVEYTVKAYDELDMCKMRISLTQNEEERSNFKFLECELDEIVEIQHLSFQTAQAAFTLKLARLKYIRHLEENYVPGPCPICHSEDIPRYAVLECGHHICLICLKAMSNIQINKNQKLTCSICRNEQNSQKIYYVTNERDAMGFSIKGDYSSKISFVVHQVLKLQKEADSEENKPKIIIFSQWQPILTAISDALCENGIRHRVKWSPKSIEEFKNPHMGITCMLMTLSHGSKGLNLIEATHVFLVEPILNPAEELQAIGRVHRFGQTKPTTIHRFIVSNTVEENIFYTVTRGSTTYSKWEFENMDLESLRSLFNFENDVLHYC